MVWAPYLILIIVAPKLSLQLTLSTCKNFERFVEIPNLFTYFKLAVFLVQICVDYNFIHNFAIIPINYIYIIILDIRNVIYCHSHYSYS